MDIKIIEYTVFFSILLFGVIVAISYKPQQVSTSIPEVTKCESPIEKRLYNGLTHHHLFPVSQCREGKYRIDLAFPSCMVAIECDGKAFHSSPDQKKHDRKKDRYLRSKGWKVLRFTGSKIHRDLPIVVQQIENNLY